MSDYEIVHLCDSCCEWLTVAPDLKKLRLPQGLIVTCALCYTSSDPGPAWVPTTLGGLAQMVTLTQAAALQAAHDLREKMKTVN